MTKIETLRDKTYKEACKILKVYGKCAIIRPTGFGKTGILTRFIKDGNYKNIVYLYPADIIRTAVLRFYYGEDIPEDEEIKGVTFLTYTKLVRMDEKEIRDLGKVDLIIADECHRLGADGTMTAMETLLETHSSAHFLGATASPDRMDMIDEIGRYFDDHVTSEYTLHDAFKDKVLKRPHYVYNSYNTGFNELAASKREAEKEIEMTYGKADRQSVLDELDQRLIETATIYDMDHVIHRTCEKYVDDTSYMKFIVFFFNYEAIYEKGEDVKKWFYKAYPKHSIETTIITSETAETRNNLSSLTNMSRRKNKIDLIFSCDMLNMGYHVSDLTGVVMYRGTKSDIVYIQQLGRVLTSATDATAGIIIDVVDNLHQRAAYAVLGRESVYTEDARKRKEELEQQKSEATAYAAYQSGRASVEDIDTEMMERFKKYDSGEEKVPVWGKYDQIELNAQIRRFEGKSDSGTEYGREGYQLTKEDLESMDLYAKEKEASYRELIAKTVAEARSVRCRKAWTRWAEEGGKTRDENGRILTRAEVLAQKAPEEIPLPPFCRSKQVSIDAVLDEMGIPED